MTPIQIPDSILVHPALAGRTLLVRHGSGWAAFEIHPEGRLSAGRAIEEDPTITAWRGGPVR
jgi:hypothetical protein